MASAPGAREHQLLEELGRLLPRARRRLWRHATVRLEAVGESMFVWPLLSRVVQFGRVSQCDLARLTAQHPAGVSRTVDDLQARGLVRRRRDPRDRRRVLVEATTRGTQRCAEIYPELILAVAEVMAPLTLRERATLRDLLGKLVAGGRDEDLLGAAARRASVARRRG